jgi:hypothetical protein
MTTPNTVAPAWPRMTAPAMLRRGALRPVSVHVIARLAFWTILLLTATNALGLVVMYLRGVYGERFVLGIYPVTFAVMAALVFVFSRGRNSSTILLASWMFWLLYFLGGFLGTEQITGTYFRATLEITLKPWMVIVGLPWLALRAITEDKFPRLIHATVLVGCAGAVLGVMQVFMPGFMQELYMGQGRGSGFWMNPNSGGVMCVLVLFLSLVQPFRRPWLNWLTRLLLIAGVAVSFSRAALLALLVGWVIYGIMARRFRTLVASTFAIALFVFSMIVFIDLIEAATPHQEARLGHVRSFLVGDWSTDGADNRTEIWRTTYQAIVDRGSLVFGLGHGSMLRVADGLVPHNYYLAVLGNSGIVALFGLLIWNFVLAQQGWKCSRRETRAALLAMASIIGVVHVVDSGFLDFPPSGVIIACFVLAVCYGRDKSSSTVYAKRSISLTTNSSFRVQGPRLPSAG